MQASETIISSVKQFVENSLDYEVYDVTYKQVNKKMVLEVIIDSPKGICVKDCENVSRSLGTYLDETDIIRRTYTLEVSSPGVERVFKRDADYERSIGRLVRWKLVNESGPKSVFRARLKEFSPEKIVVETDKELCEFPLSCVLEAKAIFEFPKAKKGGIRGGNNA